MTERQWLTSNDAKSMVEWLTSEGVKKVPPRHSRDGLLISHRQARLLACAVSRAINWLPAMTKITLEDVATAEAFADGLASWDDLAQARIASNLWCCSEDAMYAAHTACKVPHRGVEWAADLLRDAIGNPFRPWHVVYSWHNAVEAFTRGDNWFWSGYRTPQVLSLAKASYESGGPDGVLDPFGLKLTADALEEAGLPVQTLSSVLPADVIVQNHGNGWEVAASTPDGNVIIDRCQGRREALEVAEMRYRVKKWVPSSGPERSSSRERGARGDGTFLLLPGPHPILAGLREDKPRYKGFHFLDLILDKE